MDILQLVYATIGGLLLAAWITACALSVAFKVWANKNLGDK